MKPFHIVLVMLLFASAYKVSFAENITGNQGFTLGMSIDDAIAKIKNSKQKTFNLTTNANSVTTCTLLNYQNSNFCISGSGKDFTTKLNNARTILYKHNKQQFLCPKQILWSNDDKELLSLAFYDNKLISISFKPKAQEEFVLQAIKEKYGDLKKCPGDNDLRFVSDGTNAILYKNIGSEVIYVNTKLEAKQINDVFSTEKILLDGEATSSKSKL